MIRGSGWEDDSRLANLSHIERRPDAGSANQWFVLEDCVCSLGLGTLRRLSSPSLRGYLGNKALAVAAARTHLKVGELLSISVVQTAILLAIAVILGQWAARKLSLRTPLIAALLAGSSKPKRSLSTLLVAFALGIATALALLMLDHWIFAPIPAVAELIHNTENGSARPNAWQGLLASFYGAVTEEILMRLGVLSVLALFFRTLARCAGRGENRHCRQTCFGWRVSLQRYYSDWDNYPRPQHLRHCRARSSYKPLL